MTSQVITIDDYISTFPAGVQAILAQVRQAAHAAAPGLGEAISYKMAAITLNGKDLIYFAAWKQHIAFYSIPAVDAALAEELAPYRANKSTLRFPLGTPMPYGLITRLVAAAVTQRGALDKAG